MITGNVPKHLEVGAKTGFLVAYREHEYPWKQVAMEMKLDSSDADLVDLGSAPMPVESARGMTVQDFVERTKNVEPTDWDITVWISHNAMKDDKTGDLMRRCKQAGDNYAKHINKRVFQVLNGGDGTTYGLCYDGQEFFDSDHADKGADYQTDQDNEFALALTIDNFETVWVAAQNFLDDRGEPADFKYDLLIVPPAYYREAAQVVGNEWAHDTANREINPYHGLIKPPVVSTQLDSTAWVLAASSERTKPLIVVMREEPGLQHTWFDPDAPEGGRYYFKFYARYEVHYGDWRLAALGNS